MAEQSRSRGPGQARGPRAAVSAVLHAQQNTRPDTRDGRKRQRDDDHLLEEIITCADSADDDASTTSSDEQTMAVGGAPAAPPAADEPPAMTEIQACYVIPTFEMLRQQAAKHRQAMPPGQAPGLTDVWATTLPTDTEYPVFQLTASSSLQDLIVLNVRDSSDLGAAQAAIGSSFDRSIKDLGHSLVTATAAAHVIAVSRIAKLQQAAAHNNSLAATDDRSELARLELPTLLDTIAFIRATRPETFRKALLQCIQDARICITPFRPPRAKKQRTK